MFLSEMIPLLPTIDNAIGRVRAYLIYAELSPRKLAEAAGLSRKAVLHINDPEQWNPTLDTLRKVEAVLPAGFDGRVAVAEYRESLARVRVWFTHTGMKRYQLEPLGIQYEWVQEIADEDWSPSWFALRKLLALIPADFDHHHPPPPKEHHHGTRTPA